jgi:hypothetical protein
MKSMIETAEALAGQAISGEIEMADLMGLIEAVRESKNGGEVGMADGIIKESKGMPAGHPDGCKCSECMECRESLNPASKIEKDDLNDATDLKGD